MTARDRRAVAIGAIVIAVSLVVRGVPALFREHAALRGRTEQNVRLLEGARHAAAGIESLQVVTYAALDEFVRLAPRLLPSAPADAATEVQALLSGLAERHDVRIETARPMPELNDGPLTRVRVSATLECDLAGLLGLVSAMDRRLPSLAVGALRIMSSPVGNDRVERLRVEIEAYGWRLAAKGNT